MTADILFDEKFMNRLSQLALVARRIRSGHFRGDRRSVRRGQSIEFADYRNYVKGDDIRALDWNLYARLDQPFIKLFEEEVDQTVHILFDASGSMDFPPDDATANKWQFTRRLALALAYISLTNNDRTFVSPLFRETVQTWGPSRHPQGVHTLIPFLADLEASGETDLNATLTRHASRHKRPGLVFLLSDFLTAHDYQRGITALQQRGHEIAVLHLLTPQEINPVVSGDFQLVDVETNQTQDISINRSMLNLYQRHFETWQGEIANFCGRRNINYALITTEHSFENLILQFLRRRGFIQ